MKNQERLKRLLPDGSTGTGLWLAKRYPSTLISIFLIEFRCFSYQLATQIVLTKLGGPRSRSIFPEKLRGYSQESNPGPFGWHSDMLISILNIIYPY